MSALNQRIAILIVNHLRGQITVGEAAELQDWLNESGENQLLFDQFKNEETLDKELEEFYSGKKNTWEKIQDSISKEKVITLQRHKPWRIIAAAAAIVFVLLAAGLYFGFKDRSSKNLALTPSSQKTPLLDDVKPGGNKATLTLGNGKVVVLDNVQNGNVATENGINIVKLNDGELTYQAIGSSIAQKKPGLKDLPYNIITTPRGGQYQVVLGDGTKVWLNATSSITYPVAFSGAERKVAITGEVYFEVAPSATLSAGKLPFIVQIMNAAGNEMGKVDVLGTHFNINAYDDEAVIKTTLLEGSVRIQSLAGNRQSAIIKPGQQALLTASNTLQTIDDINTEEIMAWKNGQFMFKSVGIETIMRQAARWYDLEITYDNGKPTDRFTGKISRNVNLSQLLKILEYSEVHFTLLEGKKLVITKK
jgi:transmembrane sensor